MNFIIPFFLGQWRWLLPTAAAAVLGIMLGITRMELLSERTARAEERLAAAVFAKEAVEKARDKDNQNAAIAAELESVRTKAVSDIDATRGDFDRRLAEQLRARRPANCNRLPPAAAVAGEPAPVAAGSDGGRGQPDLESVRELRRTMKLLQADVAECVALGQRVGR